MESKKPHSAFYLLLLGCLLLIGCTTEDREECPVESTFEMDYTFNRLGQDQFAEQVKNMEIFLYDESGKMVQRRTLNSTEMSERKVHFNLVKGNYTVVAWGNWQPAHYGISGENLLTEMRLSLKHTDGIVQNRPQALFHANTSFTIAPLTPIKKKLAFKKNTNTIRVILDGGMAGSTLDTYATSSGTPYGMTIIGSNGVYGSDNQLLASPKLNYQPEYTRFVPGYDNALGADFTVLRLFQGDDLRVVITNGTDVMIDRQLVEMLMLSDEINNNDDLDRYDEYTLRFDANFMLTGVKVIDWTTITNSGGGI